MNAKRTKELIDKMIDFRRELIDKAIIVNDLIDEVAMANGIANEDVVRVIRCRYSIEVKDSDSIVCRHPSQHSTYDRTGDDYCSFGKE